LFIPGADVTGAFMIVSWAKFGHCLLFLAPEEQTYSRVRNARCLNFIGPPRMKFTLS
jgi:hypothetical protein